MIRPGGAIILKINTNFYIFNNQYTIYENKQY